MGWQPNPTELREARGWESAELGALGPCPVPPLAGTATTGGDGRRDAGSGWCPAPLATGCSLSQTPSEPWACTDTSPSSSSASVPQVGASRSQSLPDPGWMTERKGTEERLSSVAPTFLGLTPGWAEGLAAAWLGSVRERALLEHPQGIASVSSACPQHCQGVTGASFGHHRGISRHYWGFLRA